MSMFLGQGVLPDVRPPATAVTTPAPVQRSAQDSASEPACEKQLQAAPVSGRARCSPRSLSAPAARMVLHQTQDRPRCCCSARPLTGGRPLTVMAAPEYWRASLGHGGQPVARPPGRDLRRPTAKSAGRTRSASPAPTRSTSATSWPAGAETAGAPAATAFCRHPRGPTGRTHLAGLLSRLRTPHRHHLAAGTPRPQAPQLCTSRGLPTPQKANHPRPTPPGRAPARRCTICHF